MLSNFSLSNFTVIIKSDKLRVKSVLFKSESDMFQLESDVDHTPLYPSLLLHAFLEVGVVFSSGAAAAGSTVT